MNQINNDKLAADSFDPNDSRETMIKVDDVTMIFNIASEQLNNLKEYAIAIAKHELMFKEFKALEHISFEVKKGDVFGVLGTNGSGKSTMMKIIAGVLDPSAGTCTVNGNIAPLIELGAGFDMDLTARENVYLNGALLGYPKKFIDENFDAIIDFAEIHDFLDMPLKNYSSGMVARIAFAIATVIVPEILLVDEVLSVGDFMFQKKCENRIKELINQGVTVLIVSHSNEQIARMCNKAVWIEKGHMRMAGNAQDVCRVYGSLGGRHGSKEAETRIFNELQELTSDAEPVRSYFANNPFELTAATAAQVDRQAASDAMVVASNATHINAALGAQFAGKLNAAMLQCDPTSVPIAEQHVLNLKQPSTIYFIDCGHSSAKALEWLQELPWGPEIVDLSGSGDPATYAVDLLKYGAEHDFFSDTAYLVDFEDNMEALALTPHLRASRSAFLTAWPNNPDFAESTLEGAIPAMKSAGIKNVVVVGNLLPERLIEPFRADFNVTDLAREEPLIGKRAMRIAETALASASKGGSERIHVLIGATDPGQRLYLCSACNQTLDNGILLLTDTADMDSVVDSLDFLRGNADAIEDIAFIGSDNAFFSGDCRLLQNAIRR